MKRLIHIFAALIMCMVAPIIFAQAVSENIQMFKDLAKQVREEYSSLDYVSIYNKMPFIEQGITEEKTLDNTKPNADEKAAIKKFIAFKKRTNDALNNLYLKDSDKQVAGFTQAFVYDNVVFEKKVISATEDLYAGKLTFGQYNKKRQQFFTEYQTQQLATKDKFNKVIAAKSKSPEVAIKPILTPIPIAKSPQEAGLYKPIPPIASAVTNSQSNMQGAIIGKTFDPEANGYIVLLDVLCNINGLSEYNNTKTLYWKATDQNGLLMKAQSGEVMQGCYKLLPDTQQVVLLAPGGQVTLPYSSFGFGQNNSNNGGGGNFIQSFIEGLGRATTYWNNSAAQTQRNTTNLTPGMTGGNGMNCTPDGRGGYYCK